MVLLPAILATYATQEEKDQVTALYKAHRLAVYHEAMLVLNSHEDAEDVVQEAFILLHGHLKKLEDALSRQTRGFILLVAKYTALNKRRKAKREKLVPLDEVPYELPSQDDAIFSRIEADIIFEEIDHLPDSPRELLLMKLRYQCTEKELAAIMGLHYDTVRKRVERARSLLKERLAKYERR